MSLHLHTTKSFIGWIKVTNQSDCLKFKLYLHYVFVNELPNSLTNNFQLNKVAFSRNERKTILSLLSRISPPTVDCWFQRVVVVVHLQLFLILPSTIVSLLLLLSRLLSVFTSKARLLSLHLFCSFLFSFCYSTSSRNYSQLFSCYFGTNGDLIFFSLIFPLFCII